MARPSTRSSPSSWSPRCGPARWWSSTTSACPRARALAPPSKRRAALTEGSSRPHILHPAFDAAGAERLRSLLHCSPRDFGHPTSVWTLELAAEVAYAEGLTARRVSDETVRHLGPARPPLAAGQDLDHQSRSGVLPKKQRRDRLIALANERAAWAVGYADETWWSRLARPALHAWTDGASLRLVEQTVAKDDPDPKALACYGLLVRPGKAPQSRSGCASSTTARSVLSRPSSWPGVATAWRRRA
jgi:hypothetical protein